MLQLDFENFMTPTSMIANRRSLRLQRVHTATKLTLLYSQYTVSFLMSQAPKNANAFWTDEETEALLKHLIKNQSTSEGAGGFHNTVFQSAISAVQPFYKKGAIKDVKHMKGKWRSVHFFLFS